MTDDDIYEEQVQSQADYALLWAEIVEKESS